MLMVAAVIENLILSHFYRLSYRYFWRRDFFEVETNIKERKHLREALVSYRKLPMVINLTKVESLSSLTP